MTPRRAPNVSAAFAQLSPQELALIPNSPANRDKVYTIKTATAAKQDAEYAKRYSAWVAA